MWWKRTFMSFSPIVMNQIVNMTFIERMYICVCQILERKEYFGQYGKALKVSISRPAGTSSQKTFGVYVSSNTLL